jgi:hypothetical protein
MAAVELSKPSVSAIMAAPNLWSAKMMHSLPSLNAACKP